MSSIPNVNYKAKICVICEGLEETIYFKKLISLNKWSETYEFIPKNAGGAQNIFPVFQNNYQNDNYEVVLIFCDTDKEPYKEYSLLKKKINSEFDSRCAVTNKIVIFANPCTMQIILSHFGEVKLKTQSKKVNAQLIQKLTGVTNYSARTEQIEEICKQITRKTYEAMKKRIEKINFNDKHSCSTNFIDFLDFFENSDFKWIKEINKALLKE